VIDGKYGVDGTSVIFSSSKDLIGDFAWQPAALKELKS
jgi:hypothetical protein